MAVDYTSSILSTSNEHWKFKYTVTVESTTLTSYYLNFDFYIGRKSGSGDSYWQYSNDMWNFSCSAEAECPDTQEVSSISGSTTYTSTGKVTVEDGKYVRVASKQLQLVASFISDTDVTVEASFSKAGSWSGQPQNSSGGTGTFKLTPNTTGHTVTYNLTGGEGSIASQVKKVGKILTLTTDVPTREGYTFLGWATTNGGNVHYHPGGNMAADEYYTLYAVWEANTLTIRYHINGGTISSDTYYASGGLVYLKSSSSVFNDIWTYNNTHTYGLYNAATLGLSRTGYTFKGWKVGSSGSTVFDQNDATIVPTDLTSSIKTGDCTITMYAVWEVNTYTIEYFSNGGEGSMDSTNVVYGSTTYINNNTFIRTGYIFSGWHLYRHSDSKWLYTKLSDNTSVWLSASSPPEGYVFRVYNNGSVSSTASSVDNDVITLYAQWSPITYIIEYKGNGATGGSMTNTRCTYDEPQNLKDNNYTRYGYVFTSWNTRADGTGQSFQNQQEILNLTQNDEQSIQLFAQWEYIFVKINTTYEGKNVIGTLYARDENGSFQPVRELYQNQNNSFIRIN